MVHMSVVCVCCCYDRSHVTQTQYTGTLCVCDASLGPFYYTSLFTASKCHNYKHIYGSIFIFILC